MRIISVKRLREFWEKHSDSEQALRAWYEETKKSNWNNPNDIKQMYSSASILANNKAVFNIRGNTYRLVVAINYAYKIVFIRFIGTHKEYDRIKVAEV
ncbi:type II toxin-antitoxin system HigB family toxin [Candidatus Desantisbacteria bacterium]|nr:type II toxin-antitoxin system HigB family toxin [Candidatus Desantisbacteria bacterium]